MHIYILPQCSTTAARVLNLAGMDAQFERLRCAISRGILNWAHEPDQKKQKDLLLELDSWENRDLHRRMLVVDLLRSTEMWDKKALLLVQKELTAIALQEQDEIAAYARMALSKLKDQSERCTIADEVLRLVAVEKEKVKPDPVVFHNGCLLLYDLHCEAEFSQYADRYANLIEQAYGLDGKDLADMKKTLSQI